MGDDHVHGHDHVWFGVCPGCDTTWQVLHSALLEHYPQHVGDLQTGEQVDIPCGTCGTRTTFDRVDVQLVPFSAWEAPDEQCTVCLRDHPALLPHDATSYVYRHAFHHQFGRWPDWNDAMAHCTPEVRDTWIQALRHHGIQA